MSDDNVVFQNSTELYARLQLAKAVRDDGLSGRDPRDRRRRTPAPTCGRRSCASSTTRFATAPTTARADRLAVDQPRVEVPGRIAEPRQDHRQPEEQRDRADHEQATTVSPQRTISGLFALTARHEAETAAAAPTSRSTSIGSETTLSASTTQRDRADQPADDDQRPAPRVVRTVARKPDEPGASSRTKRRRARPRRGATPRRSPAGGRRQSRDRPPRDACERRGNATSSRSGRFAAPASS